MNAPRLASAIIGSTTMAVALAVLFALGLQAAELPGHALWGSTDGTDVWLRTRRHYGSWSWIALGASVLGWLLIALALPTGGPRIRPGGRAARLVVRAAPWALGLVGGAAMAGSSLWAVELSRPFGLATVWATALVVCVLGAVTAWWESGRPRRAWVSTGLCLAGAAMLVVVLLPLLGYVLVAALVVLPPGLLPRSDLALGALISIILAGPGFVTVVLALLTSRVLLATTGEAGSDPDGSDPADPGRARNGSVGAVPGRSRITVAIAWSAPAVLVIVLLGTWAAAPGRAPEAAPAPALEITHEPVKLPGSGLPPEESAADAWTRPEPETIPARIPPCTEDQLEISIGGWDHMTGDSAATIEATNVGEAACGLAGRPLLDLTQGGEEIDLHHQPLRDDADVTGPRVGAVLAAGEAGRAGLYWPGYRTAADLETPQTATVRLSPEGPAIPAEFSEADGGGEAGPAPFDISSGVEGGAELQVGIWTPVP